MKKKTTKRIATPAVPPATYATISNCSVATHFPPTNDQDAAVAIALAGAVTANARALEAIANCLGRRSAIGSSVGINMATGGSAER